jgi:hypothetical protein
MKTLDENFSYGYDEGIYNLRTSPRSQFKCYYRRASRTPASFREECVTVCREISDYAISQDKTPYVLLSGGLDSEVVVRSFIESGRDFHVITNRFCNDLNDHEIEYVERLCSSFNLNPIYVDIDIKEWLLSNESFTFAYDSKCVYSEMLPTMKLMRDVYVDLGGIPVLGNGDLYVSKEINDQWRIGDGTVKYEWQYIEYEYILAWMRYAVGHNIVGSINFFQQTPEVVLSIAQDPLIQNLVKDNPEGKQSSRSTKYQVYKKYWPDIDLRSKFHGAEKIEDLCDYINKDKLLKEFFNYTTRFKIPFNEFVERLMPYGQ